MDKHIELDVVDEGGVDSVKKSETIELSVSDLDAIAGGTIVAVFQ